MLLLVRWKRRCKWAGIWSIQKDVMVGAWVRMGDDDDDDDDDNDRLELHEVMRV